MLSKDELLEIKNILQESENPLFFYDNDADGLCSFLLARRFLGRGEGIAIKSYPSLGKRYAEEAIRRGNDLVVVFDKPIENGEFLWDLTGAGIKILWIDHHEYSGEFKAESHQTLSYFNPLFSKNKSSEPVTYLIYKSVGRKEDSWIGIIGCIADHYLPDFKIDFEKIYPELWAKNVKEPFQAYYDCEIGKIAQAFNFGIKDSIRNVQKFQNFLINCLSPHDVLREQKGNESFIETYKSINKKYTTLIKSALENVSGKKIFFSYSGDLSISALISNELSYRYPEKLIAIAYNQGHMSNISLRGKGVKKILEKILPLMNGANGGGHPDAAGARVRNYELDIFKKNFLSET